MIAARYVSGQQETGWDIFWAFSILWIPLVLILAVCLIGNQIDERKLARGEVVGGCVRQPGANPPSALLFLPDTVTELPPEFRPFEPREDTTMGQTVLPAAVPWPIAGLPSYLRCQNCQWGEWYRDEKARVLRLPLVRACDKHKPTPAQLYARYYERYAMTGSPKAFAAMLEHVTLEDTP